MTGFISFSSLKELEIKVNVNHTREKQKRTKLKVKCAKTEYLPEN